MVDYEKNQEFSILGSLIFLAVLTVLIMLGTRSSIFSFIGFVLAAYIIVTKSVDYAIALLLYLLPMATIFKFSPDSQSFFTYLILMLILCHIIRFNFKVVKEGVLVILFAGFLVVVELFNGGFAMTTTLKMVANLSLIVMLIYIDIERVYKKFLSYYLVGIYISSFIAYINPSFLRISSYISTETIRMGETYVNRFAGMYQDPNYYTVNIVISICLLLVLYMKKEIKLYLAVLLAVPLIIFAALTGSKSAIFAMVLPAAFLVILLLKKKDYFGAFISIICICIFLIFLTSNRIAIFETILSRISGSSDLDSLTTSRTVLWREYLKYMGEKPLKFICGESILSVKTAELKAPHNTYIDMIFQLGVLGTVFIAGIVVSVGKIISTGYKKNFMNYSILLVILIMYMFLSELQYYDIPFHLILMLCVFNINMNDKLNKMYIKCEEG